MLSKFLDPKNDYAFKQIFGTEKNQDILIHFINHIIGFKDAEQVASVEFLKPSQDPEIASKKTKYSGRVVQRCIWATIYNRDACATA